MKKKIKEDFKKLTEVMRKESANYTTEFVRIPSEEWVDPPVGLVMVWRNNRYLVQVYAQNDCLVRLSICQAKLNADGSRWLDGLTWEDLQWVKNSVGFANNCAVEIFPPKKDVVDVANMRHLFVFEKPLACMWVKS